MTWRVEVSAYVFDRVAELFGEERGPDGQPSEYDFVSGPLAAAIRAFAAFDELAIALGPSIRALDVVDPVFGAVVFTAVAVGDGVVEIAGVAVDDDYWEVIGDDPIG